MFFHKVGFPGFLYGQRKRDGGGGAGGLGIVHRALPFKAKSPMRSYMGGGFGSKWRSGEGQSGKGSGFCHLDFATSLFEGVIPRRAYAPGSNAPVKVSLPPGQSSRKSRLRLRLSLSRRWQAPFRLPVNPVSAFSACSVLVAVFPPAPDSSSVGGDVVLAYPFKARFRVKAERHRLALRRKGRFVVNNHPHIRLALHAPDQQDAPCSRPEVNGALSPGMRSVLLRLC